MNNTAETEIHSLELKKVTDVQLLSSVEQYYYYEARLLDDRKFQQWLGLLAEDVVYTVPTRHTPFLDPKLRETEDVLNVEQELSSDIEPPLRDDSYLTLMIRATRSFKLSAWADNPPARTRRFVSNVEVFDTGEGTYHCYNNVMLSFSRHGHDNHLYTYQREDILLPVEGSYKINKRNVLLDWNVITAPSVGLLF